MPKRFQVIAREILGSYDSESDAIQACNNAAKYSPNGCAHVFCLCAKMIVYRSRAKRDYPAKSVRP